MSEYPDIRRKHRTRQHIIADLSINHVERHILLAGHTCEPFRFDYGLDLTVYFYDSDGRITNGHVVLQVKASDAPTYLRSKSAVSYTPSMEDLHHWAGEWVPVMLIVYDAVREVAYWREIEATDQISRRTLHLPITQVVNISAVDCWRELRDERARARHR